MAILTKLVICAQLNAIIDNAPQHILLKLFCQLGII